MNWGDNITIGLPSEGREPCIKSPTDMRQAIEKGRRDSALINNVLTQAQFNGMSGEDKYVLLAYHALVSLEEYAKRCMQLVSLIPDARKILRDTQSEGENT